MAEALSIHADEAYNELPDDRHQRVAEKLFKCLTEKGPDNREVRRPVTLGEIRAVTEATEAEVITVIETFRQPGRSFLMPPADAELNALSLIDISHESLIRNWEKLREWVEQEAQDARLYKRLADDAVDYAKGESSLWRDPELRIALDWKDRERPTAAGPSATTPASKRPWVSWTRADGAVSCSPSRTICSRSSFY